MGIIAENRVPSIQFVLFDESGHALGFESTAELNELLNYAGHISYSIRPSERKGYEEALHQRSAKWLKGIIVLW